LIAGILLQVRPPGRTVEGTVHVVDGDTLRMGDLPIRLEGLDAPELDQICRRGGRPYRCGEHAREALVRLVAGRPVRCRADGRDRYGRSLARCRVGERDLGAVLVEKGDAIAYGGYETEEARARTRRAGVWAGEFEEPRLWRDTR
jgi:endonuclease YncB( thermonuclease family)